MIARAIAADPSNYYLNIHTQDFPDGAIRDQFRRDRQAGGTRAQPSPSGE